MSRIEDQGDHRDPYEPFDEQGVQESLLEPYKRTRKGDPETSLAAAESVTKITEKQDAVFRVLEVVGPVTDQELKVFYDSPEEDLVLWLWLLTVGPDSLPAQSESGLRTRRSELVRRGLVRDSGERRKLESGRMAVVWEAVEPSRPVHNPYGHATTRHEIDKAFDE